MGSLGLRMWKVSSASRTCHQSMTDLYSLGSTGQQLAGRWIGCECIHLPPTSWPRRESSGIVVPVVESSPCTLSTSDARMVRSFGVTVCLSAWWSMAGHDRLRLTKILSTRHQKHGARPVICLVAGKSFVDVADGRMREPVFYKAVKEADGTYTIRASKAGCSFHEIILAGVRGCNVNRIINKLYSSERS